MAQSTRRRRTCEKTGQIIEQVKGVCASYGESLCTVLSKCCVLAQKDDSHGAKEAIRTAFNRMIEAKGVKKAFSQLISEEAWQARVEEIRVPDWINLLFKLKSRLSDSAWVDLTHLTNLGLSGMSYSQMCS